MSRIPEPDASYDLAAIGCGPFNLGLAALASRVSDLSMVAFEARPELRWHPGLMFDDATLQLSFLADLVTLVDPTHPLSFLAYLRDHDRIYPFFIRERFHPTRREYEAYLRWVCDQLASLRFSHRVQSVAWDHTRERFVLSVLRPSGARSLVLAKDLVLGIGTQARVPETLGALPSTRLLHSSDYLQRTGDVARAPHITVIGSGQSAAEIVLDLLRRNLAGGPAFTWVTRTPTFAPLDYTKLVLEMTTPAYMRYFHALPEDVKDRLNAAHWQLYKGISSDTLSDIHDLLYQREFKHGLAEVELRCGVEIESAAVAGPEAVLRCRQRDTGTVFEQRTGLVIAATGYRERPPTFLAPMESLLRRDTHGRYRVRLDYSVELDAAVSGRLFVANAELHTHGVATPDLGMGAYRNATILNSVVGREVYRLPVRTAFTSFEVPRDDGARKPATTHTRADSMAVEGFELDLMSPEEPLRAEVAILGGGPAGLAAGLFTARYGLATLIVDDAKSMLRQCAYLENYLGFPAGIDSAEFMRLARAQVVEAGCRLLTDRVSAVERASAPGSGFVVHTRAGELIACTRVIVASGASAEYLQTLAEVQFVNDHDEVATTDPQGRTRVTGLYAAGALTGIENQVLISAGHGASVALALICDLRREQEQWEVFARHLDWLVYKGRYDSEHWAQRVREYFRGEIPAAADDPQFCAWLERWIATKRTQQVTRAEVARRRRLAYVLRNPGYLPELEAVAPSGVRS